MDKFLSNKKINTVFAEDIEPHEILLDKLAKKKEEELGISERKFETPLVRRILQIFFFFIALSFFLLWSKTFQLQVAGNENLLAQAQENKFIFYQIRAERGVIYDKNFNQLVFNQPSFDLILEKKQLSQSEEEKIKILKEVSQILKIDFEDFLKKIEEEQEPIVVVAENLDHQTLIILETKIKELPGFRIENNTKREYQEGEDFSHILGYTGKIKSEELKAEKEFYSILDYVGRAGVEKSYEAILRKNPGKLQIERDAKGKIISQEIINLPQPGKSLVLWLDPDLQRKIKEILERSLKLVGSMKGAAIVIDPKTGGILALVSLPSFDNNIFSKGDSKKIEELLKDPKESLFNLAIAGTYPTGSTIKPLIAAAALEEQIINPEKSIYDPGFIEVPHRYNPEIIYRFEDWKVHSWTDLRKAIAESCNVYFYTVGGGFKDQEGLGPTRIKKYLELFGWGQQSQIDLPGEAEGLVPSPEWKEKVKKENWWDGDTYHLSIGQGDIAVTPLQVVTSFTAIANGGKLLKPQLVQKIADSEKNVIEEMESEIIRENFIDSKNLQIVREGMRQAVSSPEGSSFILNSLSVKAAAKTGTAETGREGYYHTWVTVFAPYDDPQVVLTIMIENVKGLSQLTVLPAAKEILEWYFTK